MGFFTLPHILLLSKDKGAHTQGDVQGTFSLSLSFTYKYKYINICTHMYTHPHPLNCKMEFSKGYKLFYFILSTFLYFPENICQ